MLSHLQARPGETKDESGLYIFHFLLKYDRLNDAGFSNSQNLRCPMRNLLRPKKIEPFHVLGTYLFDEAPHYCYIHITYFTFYFS